MDAKIQETINQLKALALDGDSHENLSAICSALCGEKPYFGWTKGACERLRQNLIDWLEQYDPADWADGYLDEVGLMRLPKDADGEYIHEGDTMEFANGKRVEVAAVSWSGFFYYTYDEEAKWTDATNTHHYHKPTIEEILREFGDEVRRCCDTEDTIAEYAAKLRELMADE